MSRPLVLREGLYGYMPTLHTVGGSMNRIMFRPSPDHPRCSLGGVSAERKNPCGDQTRAEATKTLSFAGQVAKLFANPAPIVITSFVSPYKVDLKAARDLHMPAPFVEVFADIPIEVAEERDPKGLYKKVRQGEIKDFTGTGRGT